MCVMRLCDKRPFFNFTAQHNFKFSFFTSILIHVQVPWQRSKEQPLLSSRDFRRRFIKTNKGGPGGNTLFALRVKDIFIFHTSSLLSISLLFIIFLFFSLLLPFLFLFFFIFFYFSFLFFFFLSSFCFSFFFLFLFFILFLSFFFYFIIIFFLFLFFVFFSFFQILAKHSNQHFTNHPTTKTKSYHTTTTYIKPHQ